MLCIQDWKCVKSGKLNYIHFQPSLFFFSYNENLCKFTQMHNLHAYRGSAYTRMASGERKKNTDSIHEIGGERSEHLLDLSICIHFSSITLCKSFFGCDSYISIRLIWKWADERNSWQLWRLYRVKFNPIGFKSRQDYATWKLHKITNKNFSWWKHVCHNENEIGEKSSGNLWEQSNITQEIPRNSFIWLGVS